MKKTVTCILLIITIILVLPSCGCDSSGSIVSQYTSNLSSDGSNNFMAGNCFAGQEKQLYDFFKEKFSSVAIQGGATRFTLSFADLGINFFSYSERDLGIPIFDGEQLNPDVVRCLNDAAYFSEDSFRRVYYALISDCPFDLYWFDESVAFHLAPSYEIMGRNSGDEPVAYYAVEGRPATSGDVAVILTAAVSADFSDGTEDTVRFLDGSVKTFRVAVDSARAVQARKTVENARRIVQKNQEKSDMEKLIAYKNAVLSFTDYDPMAETRPFGASSQLISVFDNDPSTYTVCGGYARAFQYLCDLTSFSSDRICCRLVVGTCDHPSMSGVHCWNLVTLDDGMTYLADLTACDTFAYPDRLFLQPVRSCSGSLEDGDLTLSFACPDLDGEIIVSYTCLPVYSTMESFSGLLARCTLDASPTDLDQP